MPHPLTPPFAVAPLPASQKGRRFPAEWERYADPLTGREVIRFTSSPAADQHLYFTSPSITADGRRLVFISERSGNPNLFAMDLESGESVQLTDNRRGVLRQYVYHWGNHTGFGKASVCLHAPSQHAYYIQADQVRRVNIVSGEEYCIGILPAGFVCAFTHVSGDGSLLAVPITPAAALQNRDGSSDGFRDVHKNILQRRLHSKILVFRTDGRGSHERVDQVAWLTHVQFHPHDSNLMLFNHEAIERDPGRQRIWLHDASTGTIRKIRPEPEDLPHWNCHEQWTLNGREILYHGNKVVGTDRDPVPFFGFCAPDGVTYREFPLRREDRKYAYGHFTVHASRDRAYCDGYFDPSLITEASVGDDGTARFTPICRHDTRWLSQDDHPHPSLSPDGAMLIFTSSRDGTPNVYGVRR